MSTVAATEGQQLLEEARRIANDIAAPNADSVDREARFPQESIDALREVGALSAFVPEEFGGGGVNVRTLATACFELGGGCAASAMVFAMHQIQVACIVRHATDSAWFRSYLQDLVTGQRLIASVTSEVGTGGDMGSSVAALEPFEDRLRFTKQATTISYGVQADDLFVTLRRSPEGGAADQAIALAMGSQTQLEQTGSWDPLGMRGTCSPPFTVQAVIEPVQALEATFANVAGMSMVPISHILWSHVWLGIATDAFNRARTFVRAAARRTPGVTPTSARRLSPVLTDLSMLRATVEAGLREFEEAGADGERLATMAYALSTNNLKLAASEQAIRVCQGALAVCGIMGYKNDSPFSIGRHLRDSMSATLMVANERIHATDADLLLITKDI